MEWQGGEGTVVTKVGVAVREGTELVGWVLCAQHVRVWSSNVQVMVSGVKRHLI
jgi:hypothetical protein